MESKKWRDIQRLNWPVDSLERALALSGCKSLKEAVDKKRNQRREKPDKQPTSDLEFIQSAIKRVEQLAGKYDNDLLDQSRIASLAAMPMDAVRDVRLWLEAWERFISDVSKEKAPSKP